MTKTLDDMIAESDAKHQLRHDEHTELLTQIRDLLDSIYRLLDGVTERR